MRAALHALARLLRGRADAGTTYWFRDEPISRREYEILRDLYGRD